MLRSTKFRLAISALVVVVATIAVYLFFFREPEPVPFVQVTGVVLDKQGRPVKGAGVNFWPSGGGRWPYETSPVGLTNDKGTFVMFITDPYEPGIPPWPRYQVTINPIGPEAKKVVPHEYNDLFATPLEVEIDRTPSQRIELRIK
jgi:hypothetical protein